MPFNALSVVKMVATGVVGLGTTKIVGQIIKNNVNTESFSLFDKVTTVSAAWVMGGVAASATKKYTESMIDDTYEQGNKLVKKFKLDAKLGKINRNESSFDAEGLDKNDFERNPDNGHWRPIKVESDSEPNES